MGNRLDVIGGDSWRKVEESDLQKNILDPVEAKRVKELTSDVQAHETAHNDKFGSYTILLALDIQNLPLLRHRCYQTV